MAEEERIVLRSIVRKYRIYPNNEQEVIEETEEEPKKSVFDRVIDVIWDDEINWDDLMNQDSVLVISGDEEEEEDKLERVEELEELAKLEKQDKSAGLD